MKAAFRKILGYFPQHWRSDFRWDYYLAVLLLLGACVGANYFALPELTLERWMTKRYYGTLWGPVAYLVFYGVPYYATVLLYSLFHGDWALWRSRRFWRRSLFGLLVLSVDAGFYLHRLLIDMDAPVATRYVWARWLWNFFSTLTMGLPLFIFWYLRDRDMGIGWYGLRWKGFDWRPYSLLLLLMVPVVTAAAFTSDFLNFYPTLKMAYARHYEALPPGVTLAIYELLYASDFVWTELIFRGFLVLGLSRAMGSAAVVPMCTVYAFRHFGKPLGEAVSSIFGGYILGVIALHSRNILGGVWVHMGIALLMELLAIVIKNYQ